VPLVEKLQLAARGTNDTPELFRDIPETSRRRFACRLGTSRRCCPCSHQLSRLTDAAILLPAQTAIGRENDPLTPVGSLARSRVCSESSASSAPVTVGLANARGDVLGPTFPEVVWFGPSGIVAIASAQPTDPGASLPLRLDSSPPGARATVDGVSRGRTPLTVAVSAGGHTVNLRHPDALEEVRQIEVGPAGADLSVPLWRRRPDAFTLRPPYPGAALLDARFLVVGQVHVIVAVRAEIGRTASTAGREVWRFDPATGRQERLILAGDAALRPSVLALAPDASRAAFVAPANNPAGRTATGTSSAGWSGTVSESTEAVFVAPLDATGPSQVLYRPPASQATGTASSEHVVDIVWAPNSERLVIVTRSDRDPARTRLVLLEVPRDGVAGTGRAEELVVFPAEVVPGSESWDRSGQWLAFVPHAVAGTGGRDLLSVCAVQVRPGGGFRYVADLGSISRLPAAPPVAWQPHPPDGAKHEQLAYVGALPSAQVRTGPFDIFAGLRQTVPPLGLFVAAVDGLTAGNSSPRRLGSATNLVGPVWRDGPADSTLLGFVHQEGGTIGMHSVDAASGKVQDLDAHLPAGTGEGTGLAARWDTERGRALLATRAPNAAITTSVRPGPLAIWLVSFTAPVAQVQSSGAQP
jgi:hypothetical protein